MSRRNVIVALCVAAVLLTAGGLFASNMGFKLNRTLALTGTASGRNTLGLPFNRQIGIDDLEQLFNDVKNTGTPTNSIVRLETLNPLNDALINYSLSPGDVNRPLGEGEGVIAKVSTNMQYIVVGSHDPGHTVTFLGGGASATGRNFFAVPYHTTRTTLEELFDEINNTGTPTNQVARLETLNTANDAFVNYSKSPGDTNLVLVPGEALIVKLSGASNVSYVPSHY
jgi:hypothetical protein